MTDQATSSSAPQHEDHVGEVTRRRFLGLLFAVATALGLGGLVAPFIKFAYPVLKGEVYAKQKVGTTADVGTAGISFDYEDVPSMLIQKNDKTFAAYSLVCTHLGCIVKWEPDKHIFHCPCHAGEYNEDGKVIGGPPPAPLTKYKLAQEGNDLYVEGVVSTS